MSSIIQFIKSYIKRYNTIKDIIEQFDDDSITPLKL